MQLTDIRRKTYYSFGNLGNGVYNGLNNAILGLYISAFTSNPFIIGYLGSTRTMEGVVIQPLVGRLSDRTTSPLGRRRPYILFGVPISVFFLLMIPILAHLSHTWALPLIAGAIILFSITWNIAQDPYSALMIDITPPQERSLFNAILSMLALVGQVGLVAFASFAAFKKNNLPNVIFYICAIFMFASYVFVFFGVREPRGAVDVAKKEEKIPMRTYIGDLQRFKEALKLLVSVFCLWTGLNAILPFLTIVPTKIVHATKSESLIVYAVMILAAAICAYPFGRLAAKYGSRPFIVLGTVMLIVAAIFGLLVPNLALFFPLAIFAGCGFSATTVLTYPYLSQLVPGSKIGVFTGLQTAFSAVAVPVSLGITGTLIDHFGYRSIFAMLAVMMVFDVLCLLAIDEAAARQQVEDVEEAERRLAGVPVVVSAV